MQHISLTTQDNAAHIAARAGTFPDDTWYDTLLTEGDVSVTKPDGSPLLCVLRQAITGRAYTDAYAAIAPLARSTPQDNRGRAAGTLDVAKIETKYRHATMGKVTANGYYRVRYDGTLSKSKYANPAQSFVAGFADPSGRFPYCRQTAYTAHHPERLRALLPCLTQISALFATHLPDRYAAQRAMCEATTPDFVIPGTVFTTLTVNRNWQTALHQDAGDLKAGFGVMLCLRAGTYTGGVYVMPQYRIAVDLRAGDVLLSDVHEWHGNTPLVGDASRYERLTMVCYYRAKMIQCGTMAEELAKVKRRGQGALRP